MREIDGAIHGPAEDWFLLEAADAAQQELADDENFERWLASLSTGGLEHILSDLLNDQANVPFDRTA
jgi:hypothetical protein